MRQRLTNPSTNPRCCAYGNHNQLLAGGGALHHHHATGDLLRHQIFVGPDRGQIDGTPKDRVDHQPQNHRGAVDAGAIQRMAQTGWRPVAAKVFD